MKPRKVTTATIGLAALAVPLTSCAATLAPVPHSTAQAIPAVTTTATLSTSCTVGPPFADYPGWSVTDASVAVTLTNNSGQAEIVSTADVAFTAGDYNVTSGTLHMAGGAQSYTLEPGHWIRATDSLYDIAGEGSYSPMPTGCTVTGWS